MAPHPSRRRAGRASLLGAGVVLAAAGGALANPADTFGVGSRSTALGGAVVATADDFSAVYYNPAGLAFSPGTELSLGYMRAEHRLSMNGADSQVDPVAGLVGGIVAPGTFLGLPFAFGVATHLSDERISRARTVRQDDPRWVLYENRNQLLYLAADLAFAPIDWLAVGGGITFLAATRGAFGITGRALLPRGGQSEHDSRLRHEVDADLTAIRYGQLGVQVRPPGPWSFGLTYRQEARIRLELDADLRGTIDAKVLAADASYVLESVTANGFIPGQLVVGGGYRPGADWLVGVDVSWVRWSAYVSPTSQTRTVLAVDFPPTVVALPPPTKPTRILPPSFHDTVVPRLGIEWRPRVAPGWRTPLRAGYVYEPSPVPDQVGLTNLVDTDRHVFSGGAGVALEDPGEVLPGELRLDAHAQYSLLPERITLKRSAADFTGDYRASGSIWNLGLSLSLGFR